MMYKLFLTCRFYLTDLVGYVHVCAEIQKSSQSSNTFFDVHLQVAQEQKTLEPFSSITAVQYLMHLYMMTNH